MKDEVKINQVNWKDQIVFVRIFWLQIQSRILFHSSHSSAIETIDEIVINFSEGMPQTRWFCRKMCVKNQIPIDVHLFMYRLFFGKHQSETR